MKTTALSFLLVAVTYVQAQNSCIWCTDQGRIWTANATCASSGTGTTTPINCYKNSQLQNTAVAAVSYDSTTNFANLTPVTLSIKPSDTVQTKGIGYVSNVSGFLKFSLACEGDKNFVNIIAVLGDYDGSNLAQQYFLCGTSISVKGKSSGALVLYPVQTATMSATITLEHTTEDTSSSAVSLSMATLSFILSAVVAFGLVF
ncbi:hypothetical protein FGO68_gene17708 [Halteria grandinella]|uniref:Uncharacterized protein n=1 Tax=Halteria grandinella TaxID=5974 RepID=A0A8J8T347_HALGN|nr:hypothetical protein FGO68_gene17708 [Halteria grandinella]